MRSSNYTRTSYLMALFAERYTSSSQTASKSFLKSSSMLMANVAITSPLGFGH